MSDKSVHSLAESRPSLALNLDRVCTRFEIALRDGGRPRIEDFLGDSAEPDRPALLCELVLLDVHYRRQRGEWITAGDYEARFPVEAEFLRAAIAAESRLGAAAPAARSTADGDALTDDSARESMAPAGAVEPSLSPAPDAADTLAQPLPPRSTARFRILRPHAKGALGQVYVAEDAELYRTVALKEIQGRYADDRASRDRFVREAEITGGLEHPGIVPVYGLGSYADGRPFYAMRFIKGDNLREAVQRFHGEPGASAPGERRRVTPAARRFDSLEFRQLLRRFIDVCNAVAYAHSRGVLHRDLKPSNIMLGKYGETLVVDWGLAKPTGRSDDQSDPEAEATLRPRLSGESSATLAGQAIGTPAYMSPEQAAGNLDELGPAADVYSLGATLYEMLTGRVPFADVDLDAVQKGRFPRPRSIRPGVPRPLEAVCLKAMALKPGDRYGSPLQLASDVERWLADEPVTAWREPVSVRAWRWVRRHRTLTTTAAALVAAAAVGLGLLALEKERARLAVAGERDRAVAARRQTREALDAMVSESMIERLGSQNQLTKGQREFLQTALGYYREFATDAATEEEGRNLVATAHFRVAYLLSALGQGNEALTAYGGAKTLYEALVADFPAVPDHRRDLAHTRSNLAILLVTLGQRPAAEAEIRAALAGRQKLATDYPSDPSYRRDLALSHNNLGKLQSDMGQPVRAEADYRAAIAIQAKLAADSPAEPVYRQDLARSRNNLGLVLVDLGQRPAADSEYLAAQALFERLIDDSPGVSMCVRELASSHINRGTLLAGLRQPAAAEAEFRDAQGLYEKLAADFPAVPDYRHDLAFSHVKLGILFNDLSRLPTAAAEYRAAVGLSEKLAAEFPALPEYRDESAMSHSNLGLVFARMGKRAEAEAEFRSALKLYEKLADDFRSMPGCAAGVGLSYSNLGRLARQNGDAAAALDWHTKAIDRLTPIVAAGRFPSARRYLRNAHGERAEDFLQLKRFAEALPDFDAALKFDDGEAPLAIRIRRADCLARAGRFVDAAREADALAAESKVTAEITYGCACILGVAAAHEDSNADRNAGNAVELLRQSIAKGYRDIPHLLKDPDLAPLRGRADYADLLWDVADTPTAKP